MKTHIHTPWLKDTGERLRLMLNEADWVIANRYRGTLRVINLPAVAVVAR